MKPSALRSRAEELAKLQLRDNGKPIGETRALVASAAGTFQFFAGACETLEETITPSRGDYLTMSIHEPLGVIAAITPWNSPIASEAQKLAPALAAGNAVVVKPAEVTPLLALELGRICEEAGVPKGVVSVLPGKGSAVAVQQVIAGRALYGRGDPLAMAKAISQGAPIIAFATIEHRSPIAV